MLNPPPEFVAAMQADPFDDAPRLAAADWFESHGHPERARLVRLQCRLEDDDALLTVRERREWERESNALLRRHAARWLGLGWRGGPRVYWYRGFPVRADVSRARHLGALAQCRCFGWLLCGRASSGRRNGAAATAALAIASGLSARARTGGRRSPRRRRGRG